MVARLSFEPGFALVCVRLMPSGCVNARRLLKLSRINGLHLYDLLHAQQFLLVRVFGKEGKLTGLMTQDKKGYFAFLTCTCRAACYLHQPGAAPRVTGSIF